MSSKGPLLHLLSQRPRRTGSGVSLDATLRYAERQGWRQSTVFGTPSLDPDCEVGGLKAARVHPLHFGESPLDFPVPGMSDVMPYAATRFSSMSSDQWDAYVAAWHSHLQRVTAVVQPRLIHAHHLWLMSSIAKDAARNVPLVIHCHATGLRQMELCAPARVEPICAGLRAADAIVALHEGHREAITKRLGIGEERIHVVGAGFDETLFHQRGRDESKARGHVLFAGKFSSAKGLTPLLDAWEKIAGKRPEARLHIAGAGSGPEADSYAKRFDSCGPSVIQHGRLEQRDLAELMRNCAVLVLPSFYEGLPLVLVEAAASGCRLVASALPGVEEQLAGPLEKVLTLLPMPRMISVDKPDPRDLAGFTSQLEAGLERALDQRGHLPGSGLDAFKWETVCKRIETVWLSLL